MAVTAVVLVLGVVLVVALVLGLVGRVRVSDRDVTWLAGGYPAPQERVVYERYLLRHRRHRAVGGLVGVLVALVVGTRLFSQVTLGIGQGHPLGDLLFCGLTGVVVGALSAETFRLSEPPSTTVSASLAARVPTVPVRTVVTARAVLALAVLVAAVLMVLGHGSTALWVCVTGVAVAGVAEATLAAVRHRRRPVLSERAHVVDLRMRTFAAVVVARLELALAVLVGGWVLALLPLDDGATSPVGALWGLAVVSVLVTTVVLLVRAAPRAPRGWHEPDVTLAQAPA